jgi:hypothetical protein
MFPALALAIVLPARPAAGKWTIYGGGGFTVNPARTSVSNVTLKPGSTSGCGTAKISVAGTQKLTTVSRGGVTNWMVGTTSLRATELLSGVGAIKVKVHQGGHVKTGKLALLFAVGGYARDNEGALEFGACSLSFSPKK